MAAPLPLPPLSPLIIPPYQFNGNLPSPIPHVNENGEHYENPTSPNPLNAAFVEGNGSIANTSFRNLAPRRLNFSAIPMFDLDEDEEEQAVGNTRSVDITRWMRVKFPHIHRGMKYLVQVGERSPRLEEVASIELTQDLNMFVHTRSRKSYKIGKVRVITRRNRSGQEYEDPSFTPNSEVKFYAPRPENNSSMPPLGFKNNRNRGLGTAMAVYGGHRKQSKKNRRTRTKGASDNRKTRRKN